MITKSESIKLFLMAKTRPDLAALYNINMECQVNVAQDDGERIEKSYKGKIWHGWQKTVDGTTEVWKSFRIPYNAATNPEYTDDPITFSLDKHAEGIGMTGWDWKNRVSKWVAFDFDAIVGHKHNKGLTPEELEQIKNILISFDWVTLRTSTSGKGLHIYVFLDNVPTQNHTEHGALARAILGKMSALTGYDFRSKVDACGGNMWVWHRKIYDQHNNLQGLQLIKQGGVLTEIPHNWADHIEVVTTRKRKTLGVDSINFDELASQRVILPIDEEHKRLIKWLDEKGGNWWWDQDHYMLVCHTYDLATAHKELSLKGIFETVSGGTDLDTPNAFAFPIRKGAWTVRRYTPGVQEKDTWGQDGAGWTRCFYNREPDLQTLAAMYNAVEDTDGSFIFQEAEIAIKVLGFLGTTIELPIKFLSRSAKLKEHKDGRIIFSFTRDSRDNFVEGWLEKNKEWRKIFNVRPSEPSEPETGNWDEIVRHLITESNNNDAGWAIKSGNKWNNEPLMHIGKALKSMGISPKEIDAVCGSCVVKPWILVNKPFQPEYPGDRCWNINSAQFRYIPLENKENLRYPIWDQILMHCGKGLNSAIKQNKWCTDNGILTGADYLKVWLASLFQEPEEPLPYLFFYGDQNTGKSIFHEGIQLLLTRGYTRAEHALTNPSGYNGELEGAIVCVAEEIDLTKNQKAYDRIKDWVTARGINIRKLYRDPYIMTNTTHWIQVANSASYCPIFPGDTRITMLHVDRLEKEIPKRHLISDLIREAQAFLTDILSIQLPAVTGRLNIPVIITEDKRLTEQMNANSLIRFIEENAFFIPGSLISIGEFFEKFREFLDPQEVHNWTKIKMVREMPAIYPKGRVWKDGNNNHYFGNISWSKDTVPSKPLVAINGMLTTE